jgi:hypothetical protein
MTKLMRQILANKREGRRQLAELPIAEKVAKLEKLRERHALIAASPLRSSSAHGHAPSSRVTYRC